MTASITSIDEIKQKLTEFLRDATGSAVEISEMRALAGGASRESWSLVATVGGEAQTLVLRKDYPTQMNDNALTRVEEFTLMRAAFEAGVRVAKVRFVCDDPEVLGLPFFLMDYVAGESIGRKVIRAPELERARDLLPEQMAAQLARIHQIDATRDDLSFLSRPEAGMSPARDAVESVYTLLDALEIRNPAFEFALRWAARQAPATADLTFIHGDFRLGNLLVDDEGLTAVIDWEFGHVGDPHEEIGYLCMRDWRFGNDHLRAAGLCDRERFITAYEAQSGRSINRATADWWEILGNIRWGAICLSQANRHLSGQDPSVELASLGRRSSEMQLEALRLIEQAGAGATG